VCVCVCVCVCEVPTFFFFFFEFSVNTQLELYVTQPPFSTPSQVILPTNPGYSLLVPPRTTTMLCALSIGNWKWRFAMVERKWRSCMSVHTACRNEPGLYFSELCLCFTRWLCVCSIVSSASHSVYFYYCYYYQVLHKQLQNGPFESFLLRCFSLVFFFVFYTCA